MDKYLKEKQKIGGIRGNFLSIFNSKNTGPVQLQQTDYENTADNTNDG